MKVSRMLFALASFVLAGCGGPSEPNGAATSTSDPTPSVDNGLARHDAPSGADSAAVPLEVGGDAAQVIEKDNVVEPGPESDDGLDAAVERRAPIVPRCDGPLMFADLAVEKAVRRTIQKPSGAILSADVAQLSSLYLDSTSPDPPPSVSLAGLECLSRLTSFNVEHHPVADLWPLGALSELQWLVLFSSALTDISSLPPLPSLTALSLGQNKISDFSSLANAPNLEELHVDILRIEDLHVLPLASLPHLRKLDLTGNRISDASLLPRIAPALVELYLNGNPVTDLAPMLELKQLTHLELWNSVDCVAQATNIATLVARGITLVTNCPVGDN
jgi:Leucine-rich repeat (LRR) protein